MESDFCAGGKKSMFLEKHLAPRWCRESFFHLNSCYFYKWTHIKFYIRWKYTPPKSWEIQRFWAMCMLPCSFTLVFKQWILGTYTNAFRVISLSLCAQGDQRVNALGNDRVPWQSTIVPQALQRRQWVMWKETGNTWMLKFPWCKYAFIS